MRNERRWGRRMLGPNYASMLDVPEGDWKTLDLAAAHGCGILSDDTIDCWGDNYYDKSEVDSDSDGINKLYDCHDYNLFLTSNDVDGDGYSTCDGDRNDQDASINLDDVDGDGFSTSDGDCDDDDPNSLPIDADGDGFSVNCDNDCDDNNRWIYPNAPEIIDDGIDQDCDGIDAQATFQTWTDFGCVIRYNGTLDCWGDHYYNKLLPPDGTYQQLGLSEDSACVLDENGEISCWGANWYGEAVPPEGSYQTLAIGNYTSCALDEQGEATCWGYDIYNLISNLPEKAWIQISYGGTLACGLDRDLYATCWGDNGKFQLGTPLEDFKNISAGFDFACALNLKGEITCWGDNTYGQTDSPTGIFASIYTGPNVACALDEDGLATCWGFNRSNMFDFPDDIGFTHLDIGHKYICGIGTDTKLYCNGTTSYSLSTVDYDNDDNDKLTDCNDYHPFLQRDDIDEDGYSTCDGDRKDTDSTINLDDIDNDSLSSNDGDCEDNDASSLPIDGDGDGFSSNCDDDCNDNNILVYANAVELVGDGIDQDCDGIDPTK